MQLANQLGEDPFEILEGLRADDNVCYRNATVFLSSADKEGWRTMYSERLRQ
jgi:hypothetical protein